MAITEKEILEAYKKRRKGGSDVTAERILSSYRQRRYGTKPKPIEPETNASSGIVMPEPQESPLDKYKEYANAGNGAEGYQKYLDDMKTAAQPEAEEKEEKTGWEKFLDFIGECYGPTGATDTTIPLSETPQIVHDLRKTGDLSSYRPDDTWDDKAKNIFGSLYLKSADEAYAYAKLYNDERKKAEEAKKIQKIQESATTDPLAGALHTVGSIAAAPMSLADYLNQLTRGAAGLEIKDDGIITPGEYSEAVKQGIAADLNEKSGTLDEDIPIIGGKGWGDVYSIGASVAQSMVSAHTLGEWGTLVSYFGQGAASGVKDALDRGATDSQALRYGIALGVFEGLAEKIGIDNLFKLGGTDTLKGVIKNVLKQAGAEGMEEGLTSILSNIADNVIMKDKSNFNNLVMEYMAKGMSEEEAKTKAWLKSVEGIAFDTLAGAVSGGASGSIQTVINNTFQGIADTHTGREILDLEGSKSQLLDTAKLLGDKTVDKFINKAQRGNLSQNREARTLGAIDRNLRAHMSDMYNQANGVDSEGKYTREGKKMTKEQRESNLKAIADSELGMAYAEYDVNSTKAKEEYKNRQVGELQNTLAERQTVLPENTQKLYDEGLKTYLNGKTDTDTETKKYRLGFLTARQLGMTSKGRNITSMLSTLSAEDRNLVLSIGDVAADAFDSGVTEARADAEAARREAENKRKSSAKISNEKNNSSTKTAGEEEDPRSKVTKWEKNFGIDKTIDESKLTAAQKKDIDRIKRLSEALPFFDFAILDGKTESGRFTKENGFYDRKSNTIGIYTTAGRISSADAVDTAMFQAATHEVVHGIKVESPESFLELRDTVRDIMGADAYESAVSRRYEQYKVQDPDFTRADAEEEVVANALEDILNSEQQMFRLASGHRNIFSRIWQGIKDFFDRVFNAIGKFHFQSGEAQLLDKLDKRYKKLEKTFIDILRSLGTETNSAEENLSENKKEDQSAETEKSSKKSLKDDVYKDYDKPITVEDVKILRSIGRKSINEFTAEDIIKSQKWAYKFYKELGTKSPFFRAWFGDWRSCQTKNKVEVAAIPSYVATNEARKVNRGTVKNNDTDWDVRISREGETNTISHAGDQRMSEYGLSGIQDLIINAIALDSEVHEHHSNNAKNDRITFNHKLYAIGRSSDNTIGLYKITVEEQYANYKNPDDKRFHNLRYIRKIADNIGSLTHDQSHGAESTNDVSATYSIADLFNLVKTYDKDFSPKPVNSLLLNEDGTPKVFYHGTRSNFDEFILQDTATYGRALGDGFYFTPDYQKAHKFANGLFSKGEDRGGIVMPVYLRMKNPYVIELDADRTKWHNEYNKGNYDGIIDLKNQTWYVEDSTQIKSATDNIGTFNKGDSNIKRSLKDTSSVETRESIAEAFKSLAATDGEKKIVKDYAKSIEKMDKSFEKKKDLFLKLQELKGKTDSESKAQREKYATEIQKINDEITKADESLLKIAAAEPFRSVVRKYQTEAYNKGYDKGFDAREGYILKTVAKYSHTRYYNKKDVEDAIAKAPKIEDLTQNRRAQLADELTKKLNKAKNDGERAVITRDFIQTVQEEILIKDKNGSLKDLSETELANWKKSLVDSLMDLYKKASKPGEFAGGVEAFIERQKALLELDRTARSIREKKLGLFDNATQVGDKNMTTLLRDLSAFEYRKTFSESKVRAKAGRLGMWYISVKETLFEYRNAENPGLYSEEVEDHLIRMSSRDGKLSIDELKALNNSLKYFIHFADTFDKVYKNGKLVGVREEAQLYLEMMKDNEPALRSVNTKNLLRSLSEGYYRNFGEPMAIARMLDCYSDGGFFASTLEQLRQACIASAMAQMEIRAEYADFFENNKDFTDNVGKHDVSYRGVKIPAFEAMSLFMTLKREDSHKAFLTNGFTFNEREKHKAGTGRMIKVDGIVKPNVFNQLKSSEILQKVAAERDVIYNQFTAKEKEYISILEKGFAVCGELKTKRDIERMGYSETIEGYYYPLMRSEIAKESGTENFMDEIKLANSYSFTKHTTQGTAIALKIISADDVFNRHVKGICEYMYISPVIDYYDRVRYANTSGKARITSELTILPDNNSPESIHSYLSQHNTKERMEWIDKYMNDVIADVKGKRHSDTTSNGFNQLIGKLRSAKAVSLLAGNVKVWFTQLSSLIASCDIISPASVAQGFAISGNDVDKYCNLAFLRNSENTAFLAQAVASSKVESAKNKFDTAIDALMKPIGAVDRLVIERIFAACQIEVAREGTALDTEENKTKAGKLLEKVIFETQQNTFATEKSAAMRSGNELVRGWTMFTSDAMKLCARVIESYGEVSFLKSKLAHTADAGKKTSIKSRMSKARNDLVRRTAVLLASSVYLTIISEAFQILYGRIDLDDEEEVKEELISMIFSIPADMLGGLPIISDVLSYFNDGYEMESFSLSTVNDLLSGVGSLYKLITKAVEGKTRRGDVTRALKNLIFCVAHLFGVPARNVWNLVRGVSQSIGGFFGAEDEVMEWFDSLFG